MQTPEVPWRFGERYLATEFVQKDNVAVKDIAEKIILCSINKLNVNPPSNDTLVEFLSKWIRDEFDYPLDSHGDPAADGVLKRYQKTFCQYMFSKNVHYMWSLPNETISTKQGICIDTANLSVSVARSLNLDAWVVLGDIRTVDSDTLVGRHAWYESIYCGDMFCIETTMHDASVNNIVPSDELYNRNSSWAKARGIYYSVQARYNEKEYRGEGPLGYELPLLLGLPIKQVRKALLCSDQIMSELNKKTKNYNRAWKKDNMETYEYLSKAFSK